MDCDDQIARRRGAKLPPRVLLDAAPHRPRFRQPLSKAAVEDGNSFVTEPPRQPPEPAGERTVVLIVSNHLDGIAASIADAQPAKRFREDERVRQWMSAVCASLWTREIAVQVRIRGTRNMSNGVFLLAPCVVVELVTKIGRAHV